MIFLVGVISIDVVMLHIINEIYTFGKMWIGQGKPTMAGVFRFVQLI